MIKITKGSSIEAIKVTKNFSIEVCQNPLSESYWKYNFSIRLLEHEPYDEEAMMVYESNTDNELEVIEELIEGLNELRVALEQKND